MPDESRRQATQETGRLLSQLLQTNATYRRRWRSAQTRARSEGPSPAAISKVVRDYLWDIGEYSDGDQELARKLRDRIRRALLGELLTGETLDWFIGAFDMSDEDSTRLWTEFAGGATSQDGSITDTVAVPRPMGKRQWHRTMTLFEKYFFAKDRSYDHRHTLQVIQAIEDGVDSYLFNHEPYASRIEVAYGGKLGKHYEYGDGLVSDDIMLGRSLNVGHRIAVEYSTFFEAGKHYPTEVRRPVRARVENLDFAIRFDADNTPKHVWFSVWTDHYLGAPLRVEPLELDANGCAHRFVPYAQQTVLGFSW